MNGVFVQILRIKNFPRYKTTSPLGYRAFVKLIPNDEGSFGNLNVVSLNNDNNNEENNKKREYLMSPVTWNFQYQDASQCSIGFSFLYGDQQFAILKLPLSWFQKNTVVTYTYPALVLLNLPVAKKIMVKIAIHLSENNEAAFAAPKGRLLVVPAWSTTNKKAQNKEQAQQQQQQIQTQQQHPNQIPQQQQIPIQQQHPNQIPVQQQQMPIQQQQVQIQQQQHQPNQIPQQQQVPIQQQQMQIPQQQPIQQQVQQPNASLYIPAQKPLDTLQDSDSSVPDVEIGEELKNQINSQKIIQPNRPPKEINRQEKQLQNSNLNPDSDSEGECLDNLEFAQQNNDNSSSSQSMDADDQAIYRNRQLNPPEQIQSQYQQQRPIQQAQFQPPNQQQQPIPPQIQQQQQYPPQFQQPQYLPQYLYPPVQNQTSYISYQPQNPYLPYQPQNAIPVVLQPGSQTQYQPQPPQIPPQPPQYPYMYPPQYQPYQYPPPPPPSQYPYQYQPPQTYLYPQYAYQPNYPPQPQIQPNKQSYYQPQQSPSNYQQQQPYQPPQNYQQQPQIHPYQQQIQNQPNQQLATQKVSNQSDNSQKTAEIPSMPPQTPSKVFIPPPVTYEPSKEMEKQIRADRQQQQQKIEKKNMKITDKNKKTRKSQQLSNTDATSQISVDTSLESTSMLEPNNCPSLTDGHGFGFVDDKAGVQETENTQQQKQQPEKQTELPKIEKKNLIITEKNKRTRKSEKLNSNGAADPFVESTSMLEQEEIAAINDENGLGFADAGEEADTEQNKGKSTDANGDKIENA